MIAEDYVSFETAKLLKKKGFNEYCKSVYHFGSVCSVVSLGYHDNEGYGALIEEKQNSDFGKYDNAISAPTIQMAMKWLREKYSLEIYPYHSNSTIYNLKWWYEIIKWPNSIAECESVKDEEFDTYEQACESAIKYCLENLI